MTRREFITLLGGAAVAWPLGALGQQSKKLPTIGILTIPGLPVDAFRRSLRDLGWIEGQNVLIEMLVAPTVDRLPELAAELVRMKVDVIFASSSTFVEAARQATTTIPIVFSAHNDPIGVGHVASWRIPAETSPACRNCTPSWSPRSWKC